MPQLCRTLPAEVEVRGCARLTSQHRGHVLPVTLSWNRFSARGGTFLDGGSVGISTGQCAKYSWRLKIQQVEGGSRSKLDVRVGRIHGIRRRRLRCHSDKSLILVRVGLGDIACVTAGDERLL